MHEFKDFVKRHFSNGSVLMCWSEFGSLIVYYHVHWTLTCPLPGDWWGWYWHLFPVRFQVISHHIRTCLIHTRPFEPNLFQWDVHFCDLEALSKYVKVYMNKWFLFEDILDSRDWKASEYNMFLARLMSLSNFMNWSRGFYIDVQCQRIYGEKIPFWCSISLFN